MAKLLMALLVLGVLGCGAGVEPTATAEPEPEPERISRAEAGWYAAQMLECLESIPALKRGFVELMTATLVADGLTEGTALSLSEEMVGSKKFWERILTGEEKSDNKWLEGMVGLCDPMGELTL